MVPGIEQRPTDPHSDPGDRTSPTTLTLCPSCVCMEEHKVASCYVDLQSTVGKSNGVHP